MATGLSPGGSRGTGVKPRRCITAVIQAWKHSWKATGSRRRKTRRKVSCEGTPPGKVRTVWSQSILEWASAAISSQLSAPQVTAAMEMKMMSSSWWIRPCSRRGSANSVKESRSEAGSWRVGEDVVSRLTVITRTSLKRLSDPDDRCYRKHAIPGQPVCEEEASQVHPERRAFLSWCVSPDANLPGGSAKQRREVLQGVQPREGAGLHRRRSLVRPQPLGAGIAHHPHVGHAALGGAAPLALLPHARGVEFDIGAALPLGSGSQGMLHFVQCEVCAYAHINQCASIGLPSHGPLTFIHPARDDPGARVVDGSAGVRPSGLPGSTEPYT